jgi:hypothetical protein
MASVQELLAASRNNTRASASPFLSLMEGITQGVGQSIAERPQRQQIQLQIQAQQVAMEQAKADRLREEEAQRQMRAEMLGQANTHATGIINGAAVKPAPVTAAAKTTIEQDEKGRYSKKTVYGDTETIGGKPAPSGYRYTANGNLEPIPGGPGDPKNRPSMGGDGRILPANTVMALNEGQAVARMLPDVEKAIMANAGIMGPISGRIKGANPYNTNAQTVDAQFRAASQSFGRFMEGGVLRKEDEEKYRKMFPQFSDKPDVAKNKLAIVRRLLASKYESDRTTMGKSGYDVSGLGTLEIPASLFDAPDGNGKIRVSNGSEVLLIDAADEADAQKDGYARAK